MKTALTAVALAATLVCLSSCRVGVATFKGGDVFSSSGTRDCLQGRSCEFQVSDTNFSEEFTAHARPGYEFVKWRAGDSHLCGDSTDPTCVVSNQFGAGNPVVEAAVASDQMFYLVPEFRCVFAECPDLLLDSVLLELEEQSRLVEAYVATTGHYPDNATTFALSTYERPPPSLLRWIDIRPLGLFEGGPVYIVAAITTSLWDGGDPDSSGVAYFSLSGATNADNSMTWYCIPGDGADGPTVPFHSLPFECRG